MKRFLLVCLAIPALFSCSKNSGNGSPAPASTYYMSATINGKAWNANVNFPQYQTDVIGSIISADYVFGIGLYASGGDTSAALTVLFPTNITLNQATTLDSTQDIDVVFVQEDPLKSGKFDGYNTATPTGGSGTITVTSVDQANMIVEGTFTCTLGSSNASKPAMKVTDGKFRFPYVQDQSQLPPSALKF